MYYSPGAFAGSPAGFANLDSLSYFAHRSSSGWTTTPELPPDTLLPYSAYRDVSSSLEETMALGKPGPNSEAALFEGTQDEFRLHGTETSDESSNWTLIDKALQTIPVEPFELKYEGADGDLCHLLFADAISTPGPLTEQAEGSVQQLYEMVRGCDGETPTIRLVAINSKNEPISPRCIVNPGILDYDFGAASAFNVVADGGHEIFFTTCIGNDTTHHQLFVRLDGAKTLEVSKAQSECVAEKLEEVPCLPAATSRANANFVGASEDGTRVYFTTTGQLTSEDTDNGNDLYLAEIGCPGGGSCAVASRQVVSLTQVSHDPRSGEAAGVQGVLRVAPDGSRVYFIAAGDLLTEAQQQTLETEGKPVPVGGADNMYAYDTSTRQVEFVGDLCSGHEESGGVGDSSCPTVGTDVPLWSTSSTEAQTAGADGRFLVFSSYAKLVKSDTGTARQVYRFNAMTDTLVRASEGENGFDSNGNNSPFPAGIVPGNLGGSVAAQYEMGTRAISEDGSRIVFETAEPLSPRASNGLVNAYEWHEEGPNGGSVTLLSGGAGESPVEDAVIAPSGRDVFFITSEGLVPQDTDDLPDIYDARLGGGFPQSPTSSEPCSADACQGPLSTPAPLLVPGSATQAAEAPLPVVSVKTSPPPKKKVTKKKKAKKKKRKVKSKASRASKSAARSSSGTRSSSRARQPRGQRRG